MTIEPSEIDESDLQRRLEEDLANMPQYEPPEGDEGSSDRFET